MSEVKFSIIKLERPDDPAVNVILGQSHFIKTVEDMHEALVESVGGIKFGLAFCEASGVRLIRFTSTDKGMEDLAVKNAKKIRAGHVFVLFLKDTFPINVLNKIKQLPEVCHVFCATANPVEVIVAEAVSGRGVVGVIDGNTQNKVEGEKEKKDRHEFLRKIGYKQ